MHLAAATNSLPLLQLLMDKHRCSAYEPNKVSVNGHCYYISNEQSFSLSVFA
jgi:hypothetical protein